MVALSEMQLGLIQYFRENYAKNMVHPTMHKLVMTLGKHHDQHVHGRTDYERYLYELFPKSPVAELCKLAELSMPTEDLAG